MRRTKLALFVLMSLAILIWVAGQDRAAAKGGEYHPTINPADFQSAIDNPYLPLVPGTSYKFVERAGKDTRENIITVTNDTKVIMGVPCVVVHDVVMEKGILKEDTYDWYAQDKHGNVWYFGENTKEFHPHNKVSTEGSWEAGMGNNQPGIIMPANPSPGTPPYRQEFGPGHAEDMGQIVALNQIVTVPAGTYKDCVKTKEWSLLEPGHEFKWYAKGIGVVREESTSKEIATLVSLTKP